MAKSDRAESVPKSAEEDSEAQGATFRERLELALLLVVEVLCLLLFVDFLFFGFYVK